MGTLVGTDIDQFIQGHKAKLQEERKQLNDFSDQSRYPGERNGAPSPGGRRQWNRDRPSVRPAEEPRPPAAPEETGLPLGNSDQEQKKQKLNAERQREYNEMLAKRGPQGTRRKPRTPSNEGLPLGQYEKRRNAYNRQRNEEMKKALDVKRDPRAQVFDYKETEKAHMAEKRKEYNAYLQKQGQLNRKIVTPEKGMFVGPDQKDRDREVRERNLKYKQELEKQLHGQLINKAREQGQFFHPSPWREPAPQHPGPQQRQGEPEGQLPYREPTNYQSDEPRRARAQDAPQRTKSDLHISFADDDDEIDDDRGRGRHRRDDNHPRPRDGSLDRKDRGRTRDRGPTDGREKYQWYNERRLSPPLEMRRSRSLSPPAPGINGMLHDLDKRQQVLQEEYRRELAEDQRLAATQQDTSLQLAEANRQQLNDERKREYQEYLAKQQQGGGTRRSDVLEGTGATLPVGEYDSRRQQLQEERHREYVEQQQQKQLSDRGRGLPPKPATPNHFFKNMGQHDRQIQQLNEQRKKEYNERIAGDRGRRRTQSVPDEGGLPIRQHDSAELRKVKARNDEYNEFLREKRYKDAHRLDSKKPPSTTEGQGRPPSPHSSQRNKNPAEYATLPGLHYTDSAEKRKIQERNREYNDYMSQKGAGGRRKGWATPTYEEILEQKRREENQRRQDEYGEPTSMRRYGSESAINRLETDFKDRVLDKEFENRRVRFEEERKRTGGILDDDNWLKPENREAEYKQLSEPIDVQREEMAARVRNAPGYLASLPVGAPIQGAVPAGDQERESAKRRRQSDYRRELQLQMEESKAARKREKVQDLRVNASGLLDPEKSSYRLAGMEGTPGASPRREYKGNQVRPYHTKFLLDERERQPSPQSDFGDDLHLDLGGVGGGGGGARRSRRDDLLDPGFLGILNQRRPIGTAAPPPGLMYQPSTYVTGGGGAGNPYSSIDEAYHFYGMKNPLDINDVGVGGGGLSNGAPPRSSPSQRGVTFADDPPSTRVRDRSRERIDPYHFTSDDDNRSRSRSEADNYGAELARQIEEKRRQKLREKEEQMRYEMKLEEDIKNYNPFGRGGGGAPIKDDGGNAIADLRSFQRGTYQSPRRVSPDLSPRPPSPRDDKIRPPPAQQTAFGDNTYARGGHGIFGQPKTEAEKDQSDKYKDDLRDQIAEKRRRQQMEKERERMEEEKENRRLEDQRVRMQSEYDEEQRKMRAREEETRRKNEELKQQADEKKKEAERKRREADDARMREQQEQLDRERREKEQRDRATNDGVRSPPVPALKPKQEDRGKSPVVPAQRRGRDSAASQRSQRSQRSQQPSPAPNNRPPSSDVLTQLASMRKQLQTERRRVENALENSKNEPEVFDPRTIQRPPPGNKLIFENAVNKNASLPPPRAQTSDLANPRNIQQFNEHKFKAESESRRQFRSMFPEAPVTNRTLEDQQEAMLAQQEEQLRLLRERNVDGVNHFPEDFEDMAGVRNDSARARRRDRYSPRAGSINGFGSQASLDVDRIQRKNEERLHKLKQMSTGDDVSMGDPDDILERFMAKQRYTRPASGQTLQDDSWLRPGSKPV